MSKPIEQLERMTVGDLKKKLERWKDTTQLNQDVFFNTSNREHLLDVTVAAPKRGQY
jgi:hypothetical protein